jgi:hypothetical protein
MMRRKFVKNKFAKPQEVPVTHCCPEECTTCCYGWFSSVGLTEYEYEKLMEHGAKNLYRENGEPRLRFVKTRCEFLIKKTCAIYEEEFRPMRCKKFLCFRKEEIEDGL